MSLPERARAWIEESGIYLGRRDGAESLTSLLRSVRSEALEEAVFCVEMERTHGSPVTARIVSAIRRLEEE